MSENNSLKKRKIVMNFLGIDTSCYTTSLSIISQNNELIADERILLDVALGEGGLRQSDGVFKHVSNIPLLVKKLKATHILTAVAVSSKPRPDDNSYMPVFTVGVAVAESLAAFNGMPLFYTSHQEGHIAAGLWSADFAPEGPFLAVHISGGTSEVLLVEPQTLGFNITLLGATLDLHAGQLIDRIGVELGMKFPCGKELEKLANTLTIEPSLRLKGHVKDMHFNLSGAETEAKRLLKLGIEPAQVAFAVFRVIANSLEKVLVKAIQQTHLKNVLLVGGVASNALIKKRLLERLMHPSVGATLFFAEPSYATDNSVGVALIARKNFLSKQE